MMFSNKKEDKEILIDDFDVIMKHDKKLFSELIIFLSGENFLIVNLLFVQIIIYYQIVK